MPRRRLILQQELALGDAVVMTALVRDIVKAHPGYFDIRVLTGYREVWDNNPYAQLYRNGDSAPGGLPVTRACISYSPGIRASGRGQKVHMLAWYHLAFEQQTGFKVPVTRAGGDLHLTSEERKPLIGGRYWLILAGGKFDITVKIWPATYWQRTVDLLRERGINVVQAGATFRNHVNPKLTGVTSVVGAYPSARQLMNLILHADGVICPITSAMHMAAALDKPCIVIAGGRESPSWEGYLNTYRAFGESCPPVAVEHRYLHTVGQLDCCKDKGCWKHRTVALGRKDKWDVPSMLCKLPVIVDNVAAPKCLAMIEPEQVVEAVLSYGTPADGAPPVVTSGVTLVTRSVTERLNASIKPPTDPELNASIKPPSVYVKTAPRRPDAIDHPTIKSKFTVFCLAFGNYPKLAKTCLESVFDTLPADCLDLRVGMNAVCDETRRYVEGLEQLGRVTKSYGDASTSVKYPRMTQMLYDSNCPIRTPVLFWLDDDCRATGEKTWSAFTDAIIAGYPNRARMFGTVYYHDVQPYFKTGHDPLRWFRAATWWQGRPLQVRGTRAFASNATTWPFVVGYGWAAMTESLYEAGIPDRRLRHSGGDVLAGLCMLQANFRVQQIGKLKEYFWCPSKENGGRRGSAHHPFDWTVREPQLAGAT